MSTYLTQLNSEQRSAIEAAENIVLIVAGPGTGKTKTLISRIAALMQEKEYQPEEILPITFTKKAATEIKDRLSAFNFLKTPVVHTFHSFASALLHEHKLLEGKKLLTESQQNEIINKIIKTNKTKLKSRDVSLLITQYKATPTHFNISALENKIIIDYQEELKAQNLFDYDDLLINLFYLLNKESIKSNKYKQILIDEFQDTNSIQYEIIKLLIKDTAQLFVIGDPFQSIYGFRGATGDTFEKLKHDFPRHREIIFTLNYRSAENIVLLSNQLFPNLIHLDSTKHEQGVTQNIETLNEYSEAEWITNKINELIGGTDLLHSAKYTQSSNNLSFRDFAVVYRTHFSSIILEEKFNKLGIPYQIIGRDSPYQQQPLLFLILLLKFLLTKEETCLNEISSKIYKKLSLRKKELREYLLSLDINTGAGALLTTILKNIDITKISSSRLTNLYIQQLHVIVSQFDSDVKGLEKSVEYFEYLNEHEYYDSTADRITLMTMHAAKGLEFEHVFISGFEEGNIPFIKDKSESELEEEKRLFYVAITRAKKGLYLLHSQERKRDKTVLSQFHRLVSGQYLDERVDDSMARLQKKKKESQEKKSQLGLF